MAEAVDTLPPLRDVIAAHGLSARKSLGQNFLLDLNLTRRIARVARPLTGGTIVEIGPGPGGLTRALLLEGAERVVAVERDPRCIEALAPLAQASGGRLEIVNADALKIDITALGPRPIRIAANLPYNIATKLLIGWLHKAEMIAGMTLMFQREVAERIVAKPGDKAYSRLSVLSNWVCRTRIALTLPPQAFTPPPKVSSAVVSLIPHPQPPEPTRLSALEAVTKAAFGQKRKMLRASLKGLFESPDQTLTMLGIDPTRRAETLSIDEFIKLAELVMRKPASDWQIRDNDPQQ